MVEILEDVVIVGGGIAGLATAVALQRLGIRSLVLERSHELRTTGTSITLSPNAWRALDALGVAHKLSPLYDSISKSYVTDVATGKTGVVHLTEPGSDSGAKLVHRSRLLESLAEELPQNTIRFNAKLASFNTETTIDGSSAAILNLEDGTIIKAKAVIGCDGVHSVVAEWLGLSAPVESGRSAVRGLTIYPEGHGVKEVQQFLGDGARAGFAPLTATELYWFITYTGTDSSRDPELIKKLVIENKGKGFPKSYIDAVERSEPDSLTLDKLKFRSPWNLVLRPAHRGNVTVAGDAMHPMTPDLGQGGCMALEDAVVLGRNMGKLRRADGSVEWGRIGEALGVYAKERRWRVAGVVAGAYFSGRAQQGETGWMTWFSWVTKFFRDYLFYGLVFNRFLVRVRDYDCGRLTEPATSAAPKLD
ncbi:hypothetical protein H6P81_015606 [Aristolochia fimbriata]|uniref:FAD-binding domain-containing protein n=1 Tax=Aristolochia fimbriata TaxID=158543 RepID=A0AAV7E8W9_ARIFI|nr:hypothetical protein H6P81_015606 [Aristolochia fimbriata]